MIKKTIELKLTPKEIAELFCELDNHDQAIFFNEVGKIMKSWPGIPYVQVTSFIESKSLNEHGHMLLRFISEEMNR